MKSNTIEYIILRSINALQNRYRAYRISITPIKTSQIIYAVTCSWGRLSRLSRHKHFIFEDKTTLEKFVSSVLNKRKQNHYSLVSKSKFFPENNVLTQFPSLPVTYYQPTLFAELRHA